MNTMSPLTKFCITALALLAVINAGVALADQSFLNEAQNQQATRACDFTDVTAQKVTVSSSSAATSSATGTGVVRVICTKAAYFKQATTPTATSNDQYVPADSPEYIYSPNKKFAFLRVSEDGTCWVAACK